MEDGVTIANTGLTHDRRMSSGAHLCMCVVLLFIFALFMKLFHRSGFSGSG